MAEYAIIPRPMSVQYQPGHFQCSGLPVLARAESFESEARIFTAQLVKTWGEGAFARDSGCIRLQKTENMAGDESYRMEILPDEIRLSAPANAGLYRGLQSLRQLFLSGYEGGVLSIPCGKIEDKPRFPWRGFMLDCSRYFYSAEFIKHILDALSLQHVNIFHWHLTDDQGWRLPVKQYPLLAETGSWRREHRLNGELYGGFYTEAEIRDIVSFAAERHIETVPEVDFPGHASSILAAYPQLGCTGGPYQVEDRFGIFEDVLCAGNDAIFPLAEAVFDTLADLFPSPHVHIGGDEVLFSRWAECPRCRRRLAELRLTAPEQLQSWITSRLTEMLRLRGKTAVGWDEALENTKQFPLPDDFMVMSWRGEEGGRAAAAQGHRVIMTPQTHGCYLDRKHSRQPEELGRLGVSTIAQCFNMDPITPEMDEKAASLVLGGQGNLWSEIIYAGKIAEYMIFPRICALAEAFWSPREHRDMNDFGRRLAIHQRRLEKLDLLQYRGALE
ncbi:MAG: beta-N-acetylhexosaminidase [Treponema sp.]|jgi:hexosaminidase|nr:beta-N-acetylhexosaminidase [Treponema sp.]